MSIFSNSNVITNKLSHKSCYTSVGKCSTTDTIYVAECTRHSMIYVGQSSQKLNSRFNGHRSDIKVKPKACELSQHFHNNKECSIDRDLKVYMLQDNVTGSWEKREYFEDRWITRLNSKEPNGMNSNLNEFAKLSRRCSNHPNLHCNFPLSFQSPICNIATYLTKSTCYIYFIFDWSNTHFGHFSN